MSSSEGYVLNAIQNPRPLYPVYRSIRAGKTTKDEVRADTALSENVINEAFTGLQLLRMIGREEHEYYAVDVEWATGDNHRNFKLSLLHNLASECTPADWGKQAAVLLNYQYLLQKDVQYFRNDDEALYSEIDTWHRTEHGYDPQSQQGSINLNQPKFVNWSRLATYLGLLHKARGREHAVYPAPRIILESIKRACADRGAEGAVEIPTYLDWLCENLIRVERTPDGNIPAAFSRILYALVRDGHIRLRERGDTGAVGLDRTPPRKGIDAEANTIEIASEGGR